MDADGLFYLSMHKGHKENPGGKARSCCALFMVYATTACGLWGLHAGYRVWRAFHPPIRIKQESRVAFGIGDAMRARLPLAIALPEKGMKHYCEA